MLARIAALLLLMGALIPGLGGGPVAAAATDEECATFAETGQAVCGPFLAYWRENGGLAQQGFPLTGAFYERSTIDNRLYRVQYFERAVFELHTEEVPTGKILLSQLGRESLQARYPQGVPPTATPPAGSEGVAGPADCEDFAITGQRVCGLFRAYWQANGGLPQQGYPLSPVFAEQSAVDGRTYAVQYFERAVFEFHPELAAGKQVLLSQVGRFRLAARYPNGPTVVDSPYLAAGQITFKTTGSLVEWTLPLTNVTQRPLLAVTIVVTFYDATGQVMDSSLAGAVNIEPGETRTLKGISIKGLNFARYRIQPPEVTIQGGP